MPFHTFGSKLYILIFFIISTITGCGWLNCVDTYNDNKKNPQELALIASEAAKKIRGHYLKNNLPLPLAISGPEGVRIATQYISDPDYFKPVYDIYIMFLADQKGDVIVLGCDYKNGQKIFEDSTKDSKIDSLAWELTIPEPCVSTLLQIQ